jgi:hypothetical protein
VPAGLSTDFFGDPRILAGRSIVPTCIPPEIVHPVAGPAVVDMGASEFGPVVVPQTAILCTVTGESAFALPKVIDGTKGTLVLKFPQLGTGTVHVRATAKVTVPAVKGTKARPHQAKRTVLIPYGQVTRLVTKTGKVTLTLTPTIQARGSLARRGQLRVRLAITFKASGASPQTRVETVTVKFRAPTRRSRS